MDKAEKVMAKLIGKEQLEQIMRDNRCQVNESKWKGHHEAQIQFIENDHHNDKISYCDITYDFIKESWWAFGHFIEIGVEDDEPGVAWDVIKVEVEKINDELINDGSKPIIIKES